MSDISTVFPSASPLHIEQSHDLEHADIPHKAAVISEASHKCEMNNHLFSNLLDAAWRKQTLQEI